MFEIKYLASYQKELAEIISYITNTMEAPRAAKNLRHAISEAINNLREFPLAHRLYQSKEPLPYEFRVLPVNNYVVFYTVDDCIKIHHIFYNKRDISKLIANQVSPNGGSP